VLELYSDAEYATESESDWAREHAALLGVPFKARRFDTLPGPIVRAQWLLSTPDAKVMMARAPVNLEVAESSSPLMPHTRFVGLTQQGANKGNALATIAAEYSVELKDVMYVGDANNDISALQVAGHPVAMANADAEVLKIARHRVGHVDNGGLAEALEFAIASTKNELTTKNA
jgi:hypothetical protein